MSAPLLECHQLACARDGRFLFENLSFHVGAGDLLQIEGPNGCGKTTLLRMLVSLFPDFSGQILWRGRSISADKHHFLSNLLFLGHLPGVKKTLTPRENLQFLSSLRQNLSLGDIDSALEKVGLYGYEDIPGYQLSAGQLRRVALARLHVSKALLWVLDEPFTAIDQQGVNRLEKLLLEHASNGGCVVFTTHQKSSMNTVRRIALRDYIPVGESSVEIGEHDV